jgi:hypothetical protein
MSTTAPELHVLGFWAGFNDGYILRTEDVPPPAIAFRVVSSAVPAPVRKVDSTEVRDSDVVYILVAVDDGGVYRYVENVTLRNLREKWDWKW